MTKLTQQEIDSKWQKRWEKDNIFEFKDDNKKEKFYCLDMFPYPSGEPHCGHLRNYSIGDFIARYKRMRGYTVFLPFGFDSFGLPAENAAIQRGINPKEWTFSNMEILKNAVKRFGYSCSWKNSLATSTPEYYKWNQYIFIKFLENNLAYKNNSPINWCPSCNTVLANEQVENGKCERCKSQVELRKLSQWYFRITKFAEDLDSSLDRLEGWPNMVKQMQRNWIGKSKGAEIFFELENKIEDSNKVSVFTTRPDTIFGVTFMALPPESDLIEKIISKLPEKDKMEIMREVNLMREENLNNKFEEKEKRGVFLKDYVIHPFTKKRVPLYVANYILSEYGTGFVMGVPAHDQRDFDFAKKYNLEIIPVIDSGEKNINLSELKKPILNGGIMINSGEFNGIDNFKFKSEILKILESKNQGGEITKFKLRDWCISRQRYWGTPIPIIYCDKCGIVPEKIENLPVLLPEDVKFDGRGNPLETSKTFLNTSCPKCNSKARRETDTMDTFVDSSWYYLRYLDNQNQEEIFNQNTIKKYMPVDQYTGGIEHAILHLLYSRFFIRAMKESKILDLEFDEPFLNLLNQGMVLRDGFKMSKSKGNGINPVEIIDKYGADTARLFILSAAAPQTELDWTDTGVKGSYEIISDLLNFYENKLNEKNINEFKEKYFLSRTQGLIEDCEKDIENYRYNLAIVKIRIFLQELIKYSKHVSTKTKKEIFEILLKCLMPYTPHTSEELWENLGNKTFISLEAWPQIDKKKLDSNAEKEHLILLEILRKIHKSKERFNIDKVGKISIIHASKIRYDLFDLLDEKLKKTRDFKELFSAIKENKKFEEEMGFISKFLAKTLKEGLTTYIGRERELMALNEIKMYLEEEFNTSVQIISNEDLKTKVNAIPGEPHIQIE